MGCDIHLAAEVQNGEAWEVVPPPLEECWTCSGVGLSRNGDPCRSCTSPMWGPNESNIWYIGEPGKARYGWWHDRNYLIFYALAGVRFGDAVTTIAAPRGYPPDISEPAFDFIDQDADGHSHSWLTVGEILSHDWSGATGCVDDFLERMRALEVEANGLPCRVVFCFDN